MTYITDIIERLRGEGREDINANTVAYLAVPAGPLPDEHPDFLTDRDPWSRAWDEADTAIHVRCPYCGLLNPGLEHSAHAPLLCAERHINAR